MTLVERSWTPTGDPSSGRPGDAMQRWQSHQHGGETSAGSQQVHETNVGGSERLVSVAAGSILALLGLGRRDLTGLVIAGVGGGLIYRGTTGQCPAYKALGIDTAHDDPARPQEYEERGNHVSESFLVDRPPEELYAYWRKLENLPRIMTHLESVTVTDDRRSHWVAKAPRIAGGKVEWDAEIIVDDPNTRIAWRSLAGADVDNTGSVTFVKAPADRGTAVHVVLDYLPPAGAVGKWVAKLFGEEPARQVRADLRTFKRVMEVGEIPTITGQPRGTCTGRGKREGE